MKIFKSLTDETLWIETKKSAQTEKKATLVLLEYLAEVQRRRLFAKRGYSSLFTYVVQELGYSETQTSERINTLRLMTELPEIKVKIEQGSLSLTVASQIQRFVKSEAQNSAPMNLEAKLELVSSCEGQSKRQVQKILEKLSQSPSNTRELKLKVSQKFMDQLEEVRTLEGHNLNYEQVLEKAVAHYLEALNTKLKAMQKQEQYPTRKSAFPEKEAPPQKQGTRYIRVTDRRITLNRARGRCEYIDPQTGRRCEGQSKLQFEHRKPHATGGSNHADNLLLYCATHNQLQAIRFFGEKKMSSWISGIG